MTVLPSDYEATMGCFPYFRARLIEEEITPLCGSPIEVLLAVSVIVNVRELGGEMVIVTSETERDAARQFYIWPQAQLGKHRVDFVMGEVGGKRVVVECDGREFHHATREQIERDRARDAELSQAGYRVVRYPGTQIHNDFWGAAVGVTHEFAAALQDAWLSQNARFFR